MTHFDFVAHTLELPAFPGLVEEGVENSGHIMGVTVAAWLTRFPMRRWGLRWLEEGSMTMRFRGHLRAGEPISVTVDEADDGGSIDLALHGPGSALAGDGRAWRRDDLVVPALRERADTPDPKVPATTAALSGRRLGTLELTFDAERDLRFTRFLEEDDPWRTLPLAHPAWLAAAANRLLSESIEFTGGHWTHAGLAVHSYRPIPNGSPLVFTGEVDRLFQAGGHNFAEVDVQVAADGELAVRVGATIIYA